ncbi:MAG TPA: hypothetical protein P5181_07050 [Dermatophilaceae bacterium]|nr:hypothetical protein [Dermatophilaceae bacterium]
MIWAALRHRPGQAWLLALLAALVVGCASFGPLYARALEHSLLRGGLDRTPEQATAFVLSSARDGQRRIDAATVRAALPPSIGVFYDAGVEVWTGRLLLTGRAGVARTPIRATAQVCAGLDVVRGRCAEAAYEVLVSEAEATLQGWGPGTVLTATEQRPSVAAVPPFTRPLTVVGTYRQHSDRRSWAWVTLEGRAGTVLPGLEAEPLMDDVVTTPATFADQPTGSSATAIGWTQVFVEVTHVLRRDRLSVDDLPGLAPQLEQARAAGLHAHPSVDLRTGLGELTDEVVEGQRQARVIVPLLMAQLALLGVVVLGLVAGSAIEQRRQEAALARLRGAGAAGAQRLLLAELGTAVLLGAPIGVLAAVLATAVVSRVWLAAGVPLEVPTATYAAALAGVVVAGAALVLAARRTASEPLAALLRRVPPRRRTVALGLLHALVIGVSLAGLVGVMTGTVTGPLALLTPALVSLAVGLLLAHLIVPLAGLVARRATRRGSVPVGLAAAQVARRPAVRRVVTLVTVATALTVFAADAAVVGARNREWRARTETGAALVVGTTATSIPALVEAVAAADPGGERATPVVWVRQGSADALRTMAVVPGQFERVADLPVSRDAFVLDALRVMPPQPARISGRRVSVTVTPTLQRLDPTAVGAPGDPDRRRPIVLSVRLALGNGAITTVGLGEIPPEATGQLTLGTDVDCTSGCAVLGIGIERVLGDASIVRGRIVLDRLAGDAGPPADLGRSGLWEGRGTVSTIDLIPFAVPADVGSPTALAIDLLTDRTNLWVPSTAEVGSLPGLLVGAPPPGSTPGRPVTAAGIDGISVSLLPVGTLPYAPGGGTGIAVASLPALATRASTISMLGRAEVYLRDPALLEPLRKEMSRKGITVREVVSQPDRIALYEASASAWGLRLAVVVGVLAIVLAALVLLLVAATAWRGRARDYAALRMAGVGAGAIRAASIAEQGAVVVVAVLVGAACGVLSTRLALPMVPLFNRPSETYAADLSLAWPTVLAALGLALVVLVVVAALVGVRLAARATPDRLRESL